MSFLILLIILLNTFLEDTEPAAVPPDRPNILWITIEDTSPRFIGSYGNKNVKTPTIDRLAGEGVRFTNAFATATVCSHSRSTIITGVRTELMGTGNHRSQYPIPDRIRGFPYYLRQAGYYTSNNKKTDYNTSNASKIIENSWNESSGKAGWWNREDKDQAFFSVFNYAASHQSRTMTHPYAWYKEYILDKLKEKSRTYPEEIDVPPFYHDTPEMRKELVRVHNSLNYTDIQVKHLLERLKEDGLMDDTIIFFYGDHGEGIPRGKGNAIGLGYRVPFIIWFPEKYRHLSPWQPGKPSGELLSFEDLAPTMLSLAGVEIPNYMTGRALLGPYREEPPNYIYGARNRLDETLGLSRTIMDGQYLYTRNFLPQYPALRYQKYFDVAGIVQQIRSDYRQGKLNSVQVSMVQPERPTEYLYDLKKDPWEINNLADNPDYKEVRNHMRGQLYENILDIRGVHFLPEYELAKVSRHTTPYDFRTNQKAYPLKEILKTASLVGGGKEVIDQQIALLNHRNKIIRYWAAVGLHVQKKAAKDQKDEILDAMNDSYPPVRIEMAALAYTLYEHTEAKDILHRYALGENVYLALQVLTAIQYMEEHVEDFIPLLQEVRRKYEQSETNLMGAYNVISSTEVTLHYANGEPLYYDYLKKWMPESDLQPGQPIW